MSAEAEIPLEERILQVLQHLGIEKAHFGGLNAVDWGGLVLNHPDRIASLTLIAPIGMSAETLVPVANRLLVFTGDQGSFARIVAQATEGFHEAKVVVFKDYEALMYVDVVSDHSEAISSTMLGFLPEVNGTDLDRSNFDSGEAGEIAGITYRILGEGPPLVLLPLALARSQWEPIIPRLAEKYCVVTLGGAHLGHIRDLEARALNGYGPMVRNLMEDLQIAAGEAVLDVGCGSGVYARDLAVRTGGENAITAIDHSSYMVAEASSIARARGMEKVVNFREGNAESLPFPDGSFDVVYSITVMEEVDADRMLSEMVRVTRPGGRIGVIVRAVDTSYVVNLPVSDAIKQKIERPGIMGAGLVKGGCADRSLYDRFVKAGLGQLKASAQLGTYSGEVTLTLRLETQALRLLSDQEAEEWRRASAQAKADGTFFIAGPFHCAVGTKPK